MARNSKKRRIILSTAGAEESEEEVKGPLLVLGYFGIFLLVTGILVMLPLLMLIFYPEEHTMYRAFLIPGAAAFGLGALLSLIIFRRKQGKLTAIQDLVLLIGVWILVILFSSLPYLFYGYNFTQALFESTSGYTSTGLSVMDWNKEIIDLGNGTTDVSSHMLFFHRALTELIGGIGLVLVVSSAVSEKSGLNIYLLEGHNDKLLPNLVKSARLIFSLYLGYIVLGGVLYIAVGVKPYDAFLHAMTAVATGGFSTKSNNINTLVQEVSLNGAWRGVSVEIITEVLMILGGTNFVIHYSLLRGKFKVLRHFEFVVFFCVLLFIWPFMVVGMTEYYGGDILAGFRYGTFEMLSGLSTCGFQAVDSYQAHTLASGGLYGFSSLSPTITPNEAFAGMQNGTIRTFPTYLLLLLGICMTIGMQNGSTSGAIKQNRIALFGYDVITRIRGAISIPERHQVMTIHRFGQKTRVEREEITEAETFIAFYVFFLLLGTTVISTITSALNIPRGDGMGAAFTWLDCFFEFSSCIGTVGLGCGITCHTTVSSILWIEMVGMLLGRLEIFVYFTLIGKIIHHFRHRRFVYKEQAE